MEANREAAQQCLAIAHKERQHKERQQERLAESQQHMQEVFAESAQQIQEVFAESARIMEESERKLRKMTRQIRERKMCRLTFRAWVACTKNGYDTPPEGTARADPIELEQLYAELDALSLDADAAVVSPMPNSELNLAMARNSPTCVMCTPEEQDSQSAAGSVITQSEVAKSVATSQITLESTLHLRQRKGERGITRRELQSTLKHGAAERDPSTGRVMHRHRGLTFTTDPFSKVGITAWRDGVKTLVRGGTATMRRNAIAGSVAAAAGAAANTSGARPQGAPARTCAFVASADAVATAAARVTAYQGGEAARTMQRPCLPRPR